MDLISLINAPSRFFPLDNSPAYCYFHNNLFFKETRLTPSTQTTSSELFEACETIFGSDVNVSIEFLECLQPVGIKTAYRKRALETHPDRAKALGSFARDLNTKFIDVQQAYEKLLLFVETNNGSTVNTPSFNYFKTRQAPAYKSPEKSSFTSSSKNTRPHKGGQKKTTKTKDTPIKNAKRHPDHFYTGSVPKGRLMIGQFLYYSGLISWRTLIEAICWQRRQRPQIGQIAIAWGLISSQDIIRILTDRTLNEKFGECALRIGYISNFEQMALVGKQRQLQRPLGEYFVKSGILSAMDVMSMANKQLIQNMTAYGGNK
jgi:DnaJ domain